MRLFAAMGVFCFAASTCMTAVLFSALGVARLVIRWFWKRHPRHVRDILSLTIVMHYAILMLCSVCAAPVLYMLYGSNGTTWELYVTAAIACAVMYSALIGILYVCGGQRRAWLSAYFEICTAPSMIVLWLISSIVICNCAAMIVSDLLQSVP